MALYYLDFKVISRSKSATTITAKAAYRSGEKIHDTTNGETYDYTRKKGVYGCEILTPDTAPGWASNRSELWNAVERKEDQSTRRNTAQLAREMLLALPTELDHDQKQKLVREYVQTHFVKRGMIADIAYHDFDSHNPHAHVLLTMREITADGFGTKNRTWNNKKLISEWREQWANHVNRDLEQAGHDARVDHRSLKEQGIDRVPQVHLGPVVCEMERNGVRTDVGDTYRAIANENRRRAQRNTVVQQQHASAELILSTQADGDTQQASDERSLIEQWQQYKELEPERDKPQETSVWEEIKSWGVTDRTIDVLGVNLAKLSPAAT